MIYNFKMLHNFFRLTQEKAQILTFIYKIYPINHHMFYCLGIDETLNAESLCKMHLLLYGIKHNTMRCLMLFSMQIERQFMTLSFH